MVRWRVTCAGVHHSSGSAPIAASAPRQRALEGLWRELAPEAMEGQVADEQDEAQRHQPRTREVPQRFDGLTKEGERPYEESVSHNGAHSRERGGVRSVK